MKMVQQKVIYLLTAQARHTRTDGQMEMRSQ